MMDSIKRTESLKFDHLKQRSTNFLYKGPDGKHLRLQGHTISAALTQLHNGKAATENIQRKRTGCVPIQLYLQKKVVATFGP